MPANPSNVPQTVAEFFDAIFTDCDGLLELRALPTSARAFVPLGDRDAIRTFAHTHGRRNSGIYFGVATRVDTSSGGRANCQHLGCLFVDIDFAHVPEDVARQQLLASPLRETARVASGGGLHVYFALREPWDLQHDADPKPLLRRLAAYYRGDFAAAEAARVLRLPSTKNRKYRPARWVQIEHVDPDARYNPSDFEDWLPDVPDEQLQADAAPFTIPDVIPVHERNNTLFRLARSLKAKGLPRGAIEAAVRATNDKHTTTPLPDDEVAALIDNAWTRPDRVGFTFGGPTLSTAPPIVDDERPLAEPAPDFVARTITLVREPDVIPQLVPAHDTTLPHGDPRTAKTWWCLEVAIAATSGTPAFGLDRFTPPARVVTWYVSDEDSEQTIRDRLQALCAARGLALPDLLHLTVCRGVNLDDPEWQRLLIAEGQRIRPALTILEPLRSLSSAVDQGPRELKPLRDFLSTYKRDVGSGLVLGHHDLKPPANGRDERARPHRASGGGLFSVAECPVHLETITDTKKLVVPSAWKHSLTPPAFTFTIDSDQPVAPTRVQLIGDDLPADAAPASVGVDARVLDALREHGPASGSALAKRLGLRKNDVYDALHRLAHTAQVDSHGAGKASRYFVRGAS